MGNYFKNLGSISLPNNSVWANKGNLTYKCYRR